jgi:hypothetical protein
LGRTRLPLGLSARKSIAAETSVMPLSSTTNSMAFFRYPICSSSPMVVSCFDVDTDLRFREKDVDDDEEEEEEGKAGAAASWSSSESHQDWPGGMLEFMISCGFFP